MLHTLPLVLALSYLPAQEGKLEIVNPRSTYGHLGAPRPRTGVQGGDAFHFAFDVKGMTQDANGRVQYSMHMQVRNEKKEVIFNLGPRNATAINFLGGDTVPCAAHLEVPLDAEPGVHTLHVEIVDLPSGRKATFEAPGKILPDDFGLIRIGTFADADGRVPMSPIGVVGETLNVGFSAVNFMRNQKTKQPDVSIALRVLDEQGKQVSPPLTGRANQDIPEDIPTIPMQFGVTLNRVGRFTLELSAKDELTGKTAQASFTIQVFELK
jgi:hypothetical protein